MDEPLAYWAMGQTATNTCWAATFLFPLNGFNLFWSLSIRDISRTDIFPIAPSSLWNSTDTHIIRFNKHVLYQVCAHVDIFPTARLYLVKSCCNLMLLTRN